MNDVLRVLVVDDSRLARQELRTLLAGIDGVACVGEADDVPVACRAIQALQPDVVLLDVQMPSGSGFEVLEQLAAVPPVVFVTAYDAYAVRAFQANALDYLVKPVEPQRLQVALQRVRQQRGARPGGLPSIAVDDGRQASTLGPQDQVFVRDGERCWFVTVAEISRIVVDGNYSRLWFRGHDALLARSLGALEARLPPALFFRANRNSLINLRMVRAVEPSVADGYDLTLADGGTVEVSRRQARALRERLAL